jgi:hypothetical protein
MTLMGEFPNVHNIDQRRNVTIVFFSIV